MSIRSRLLLPSCAAVLLLGLVLAAQARAQLPPYVPCFLTGCDDGNACTTDICVEGLFCLNLPASECTTPFLCYDATASKGVKKPKSVATGVHVVDVFEDLVFTVVDPREVCNPASDGESVPSSPTHMMRYELKADKKAKRSMPKGVVVDDQFGTLSLDAIIGDKLLVPAAKSLTGPPEPLESADVDHFKCYDVAIHKGTPKFPSNVQVTLTDEFTGAPKTWNVVGPAHLCPVAQKNDEPVLDPCAALVCYDVADPVKKAKFKPIKNVYTLDQFGAMKLDVVDKDEVCIPATIREGESGEACLGVSTTSTSTTTTTSTSTTTTPSTTVTSTTVTSTTITTTTTSTTTTTVAASCAGASCTGGGDCTSGFCDDSQGPGVCAAVCAGPATTCVCGSDCTSGFCNDAGGSPGFCAPVCAGSTTTCVCGGDCTSGFCDGGVCAPVSPGGACVCGGDCTSQNCQGNTCQSNCAGGACANGGDCSSGFCDTGSGTCQPVAVGGPCVCGGDCTSQNCDVGTGTCQPNCAGGSCVSGGDCTSGFCDTGTGTCQPVFPGGSCVCGGDCVDGFCDDGTGTCVGLFQ